MTWGEILKFVYKKRILLTRLYKNHWLFNVKSFSIFFKIHCKPTDTDWIFWTFFFKKKHFFYKRALGHCVAFGGQRAGRAQFAKMFGLVDGQGLPQPGPSRSDHAGGHFRADHADGPSAGKLHWTGLKSRENSNVGGLTGFDSEKVLISVEE